MLTPEEKVLLSKALAWWCEREDKKREEALKDKIEVRLRNESDEDDLRQDYWCE